MSPTSTSPELPAGPTRMLPGAPPASGKRRRFRGASASDFLPVFLVKEIRQSLRSRRFVRSFFGLQLLLQLFTITAIIETAGYVDTDLDADALNILFWVALSLPLLLIPPLSIMAGMGRTLKDRSLDLVFMTSLSAWRAVVGIWLAYLAEGFLLTLAALPYVVLRYYLGGVDLIQQLCLFAILLLGSSLLTAITLGLSTYRPLFVRLIILLLAAALGFVGSGIMIWIVSEFKPHHLLDWRWMVFLFAMLPILGWLSLRLAASHLCPPAESHSAQLRAGTLLLLALAALVQWKAEFPNLLFFLIFVTPLLTESLCEPFRAIGPLYTQPGARLGFVRRCAGRVFYGGWPAGLNFIFVFYALLVASCLVGYYKTEHTSSYMDEFYLYPLRLAGGQALTILGAALIHRLCNPHRDPTQGFFGIAFIGQLLYMMVAMGISGIFRDESFALLYIAPLAGSLRAVADFSSGDTLTSVSYVLYPLGAVICYFILSSIAAPAWRAIRTLESGQPLPTDAPALPASLVDAEEAT